MNITFIWPGKTKDARLASLSAEYLTRLQNYAKAEVVETRTGAGKEKSGYEAEKMLARLPERSYIILLDEKGKSYSSKGFSEKIGDILTSGANSIVFIVCGESGCTKVLKERADMVLSLTPMTMTHEIARMVLLEQIYRAFTILNNHPYHK
jgi:23S rRNA (pseudouridine1915-N3)-methyltransferase